MEVHQKADAAGAGAGGGGGGGGGGGDSNPRVLSSFVKSGDRQVFSVELRPGETTIVSWKKLVKDANKPDGGSSSAAAVAEAAVATVAAPSSAAPHAALEPRAVPGQPVERETKEAAPLNSFSAVIEKIERLYMGKDSSDDEDLNDIPDEDQYDTEDSFIDDAELDEYFEVENADIKYDGFFVNRGKLECINKPTVPPNQQPKKRRRRDFAKINGEKGDGFVPNKHVKVDKPGPAKAATLAGKHSSNPSQSSATEPNENLKSQNQYLSGSGSRKKSVDSKVIVDPAPSAKVVNGDALASLTDTKDIDKHNMVNLQSKNHSGKLKDPSRPSDVLHHRHHDKSGFLQQSGRQLKNVDDPEASNRPKEKSNVREVPDLNMPDGKHAIEISKPPHSHRKDGSSFRPKSTMLEKAIRDLEKIVAESRPPAAENQDADYSSQSVKRRLPSDVKLKLAKVARLAQSSHGKISKELINRLMSILGHLVQLRTLKRNLKVMVTMGLSAKQDKENRFQQIKKEVADMVRMRIPSLETKALQHQSGASDDFQESEEKTIPKKQYDMDAAMEDKICDLYDLFIDGLDEDTGPQVRKLYAELAELWPNGFMAICRAKEKRRALYSRHKEDQEKIRRKKMLAPKIEESVRVEGVSVAQPQPPPERLSIDSGIHGSTSASRPIHSPTAATARIPSPSANVSSDRIKQEKTKVTSSNFSEDARHGEAIVPKKKVKRKPEVDLNEMPFHSEKFGEEKIVSSKPNPSLPPKINLQPTAAPSFEQSS
ncbi:ubinuclein-1 isoform X1 [Eucalyptus grandis]|uniref:ubinuclein-1 isoform X1 n=1 Tax=Eucalyptus grandis TaxID=71139 RepID=UPI00192E987E|nr:ubinuclein-1 isoform X1 [Eucalyptus grandis]